MAHAYNKTLGRWENKWKSPLYTNMEIFLRYVTKWEKQSAEQLHSMLPFIKKKKVGECKFLFISTYNLSWKSEHPPKKFNVFI